MATFSARAATPTDDTLVADYFYLMWQDYDMHSQLAEDWQQRTLSFIKDARERLEYAAFVAELNDEPVGVAACQVFAGLYPGIFQTDKRKYGYIWGVYVIAEQRGKGIAKQLTTNCISYLRGIGCTRINLHASPMGRPVYEKLRFQTGNEMFLELNHD